MDVPWTPWELAEIRKERPDLVLKPVPPLDWVVVEFLKEHDVDARPVRFEDRSAGEVLQAGVMGAMGTFEIAAWAGLKGQEKAHKAQEWTSWKQWALSHAEFAAFKDRHMGEPRRHNAEIEQKLAEPAFVAEWKTKLAPDPASEPKPAGVAAMGFIVVVVLVVATAIGSRTRLELPGTRSEPSKAWVDTLPSYSKCKELHRSELLQIREFSPEYYDCINKPYP